MKLLLLGMLMDGPMHGYDLKKTVEEKTGDFTDYKFGSVYFALKKLTQQNFTKIVEVTSEGARPQKKIYEITESGKQEFQKLLTQKFKEFERKYYSIDECLFFSDYLDDNNVIESLKFQLEKCYNAIYYLEKHILDFESQYMKKYKAKLIIEHSLFHLKAERDWLIKTIEQISEENNA